ncbi:hypothetical protein ACLE20_05965 [Rhizobium sp. YIM 134829]|uniref:hypothetical protein n=1 Tax=Rhizobium sp. YIM 134829 TaxID=3390453 RepID=UPI00397AD4D3
MFARSVFQSVLERLQAEDAAADPADTPSARIAGLGAGFAAETQAMASGVAVEQAYADMAGPPTPPPPPEPAATKLEPDVPAEEESPPEPPSFLSRLTLEEVLADLGIRPGDNPTRLAEQRRAFAALNHPDRHDPSHRAAATRRMMLANMLVDEALRRWRRAEARAAPRAPSRPRPQGQH